MTATRRPRAGMLGWLAGGARPAAAPEPDAPVPDAPAWIDAIRHGLADLVTGAEPRAIYCIANADGVPVAEVRGRLGPRDLLCQYNGCRHATALSGTPAASILFLHMTERPGQIHGLDDRSQPAMDLGLFAPGTRFCIVRSRDGRGPVPALPLPAFTLDSSQLQALLFRSEAQMIPSAGFASVLALHFVNLLRGLDGRAPHRIILCGFTGEYRGTAYLGHDFQFEQVALDALPGVERLGGGSSAAASRLHHTLAEVFTRDYDGHRRAKGDMLFDIAKLHLAAGDMPAFVDYVQASAGLSPGFSQAQWLIRALDEVPAGAPAAYAPALRQLATGVEALRRSWQTGASGGSAGAAFRSDIQHGQAAYAVGDGGRPRVLVLNETAKMPFNKWHLGCDLVSRTLVDRLAAAGLDCVGWANGIGGLNRILAHDPQARFEAVVVNGEGTLHDDADRAFEIGAMAQYLKGLGKKVFLVNTVWENNGARLTDLARVFDLVAARESLSVDNLRRAGLEARLVPDLCWAADLPAADADPAGLAVLDCVEPARTDKLARVARGANLPIFVMDRFYDNFHRMVRDGMPPSLAPRVLRAGDVRAARGWIGGRFHGVVLALGAGVPILSVPSNTAKIQSMLTDIGLRNKTLTGDDLEGLRSPAAAEALFTGHRAFDAADWDRVTRYRTEARTAIDRLFTDIAAAIG